ncbi:MAG: zinc ribbon domain-containing protein [Euryarchaeota archaeon]|nr:zinc ribbon domain-containing protein [Euryarchaeota archaeon]MDE1837003.1 zinc ribbon domain-containing protein [Euryarchaeota archaeon]MDE1879853.1 zinc ribbon domain-containing protein [Euryarchaeota archaeon]MDE2045661.1 zinc ribbon domain-containing protein [Thermoplasmata archaeon]
MTDSHRKCPICGADVAAGVTTCPMCSTPLTSEGKITSTPNPAEAPTVPRSSAAPTADDDHQLLNEHLSRTRSGGGRGRTRGPSASLTQRMQRLQSWQEKARGLRVVVPTLPGWVEGMGSSAAEEERWEEGVRGLERAAYKELSAALEAWQRESTGRLNRLEAYGLPSPTERRSLEEIQRELKGGNLDRALELYQKVANVVIMKERNLDDAIDAVEAVKVLASDMEALGIPTPWKDLGAAPRLESELRAGKVSEAHEEANDLRKSAGEVLSQVLPPKVNEAADRVAQDKGKGQEVATEAALLARAARALRQGRSEDALREMVRFQSRKTLDPFAMVEESLRGGG